ncbi:ABC transporter integral membrane type 1 [Penicillium malachiteum]|nr:ABC transporter integral membrane type 1 [Penicillium malachiteum]
MPETSIMQPSDIAAANEDWVIYLCHRSKEEGGMIGRNKYGDKVIKIPEQIVVKYGYV